MDEIIIETVPYHPTLFTAIESISEDPRLTPERFFEEVSNAADTFPPELRHTLSRFHDHGNRLGVLLFRGLLPSEGIDRSLEAISERCLALFGGQLGQIFGYRQIDDGELFHNIIPQKVLENEQSYAGSKEELMFHTEQHFHPFSPDYVLLFCLRSPPDAATFFASVRELEDEIDEATRKLLFEPLFRTGVDHVFGNTHTRPGNGPIKPVLYGSREDPFICYDQDLMRGTTPAADAALKTLHLALEAKRRQVSLQPGDLLIIDNRRAVHGRNAFGATYDENDRWLKRAKVQRELIRAADELSGYVITTERF